MAVPGYEAYCFDVAYPAGYSFAASAYTLVNSPAGCAPTGKEWVAIQTVFFDSLVANAAGSSGGSSTPSPAQQFTAEEVASLKYQAANPSPFNLSIPEGSLVAGAVTALWATAWGLKMLRSVLSTDGEKE